MKICNKCRKTEDKVTFGVNRKNPDGKKYTCNECLSKAYRRKRYTNWEGVE